MINQYNYIRYYNNKTNIYIFANFFLFFFREGIFGAEEGVGQWGLWLNPYVGLRGHAYNYCSSLFHFWLHYRSPNFKQVMLGPHFIIPKQGLWFCPFTFFNTKFRTYWHTSPYGYILYSLYYTHLTLNLKRIASRFNLKSNNYHSHLLLVYKLFWILYIRCYKV